MTDAAFSDEPKMDVTPPETLAARLASKICHDFANSIGGVVTGLDLLNDPTAKDMRDDAMELIAASAKKLAEQLAFARIAYGASAGAEGVATSELRTLAEGVYGQVRPDLDWQVKATQLPKAAAQVLLGLVQISAAALPFGGLARIEADVIDGWYVLAAEGDGARSRLHVEVLAGLAGEQLDEGLMARWVAAYFTHALAASAGGRIEAAAEGEHISLVARIPA